ncbi:MAG TPA: hypothetical protein PK718_01105 [Candidatus Methanofastidiosa archaeon]|nr:hypothetical protein [Candidatus Methanofastidiosa archaeon]
MEMTPDEIAETDRQNIKHIFDLNGIKLKDNETESVRMAMIKCIALKQIAASALVGDAEENQDLLIALYTVALSNLSK